MAQVWVTAGASPTEVALLASLTPPRKGAGSARFAVGGVVLHLQRKKTHTHVSLAVWTGWTHGHQF